MEETERQYNFDFYCDICSTSFEVKGIRQAVLPNYRPTPLDTSIPGHPVVCPWCTSNERIILGQITTIDVTTVACKSEAIMVTRGGLESMVEYWVGRTTKHTESSLVNRG